MSSDLKGAGNIAGPSNCMVPSNIREELEDTFLVIEVPSEEVDREDLEPDR